MWLVLAGLLVLRLEGEAVPPVPATTPPDAVAAMLPAAEPPPALRHPSLRSAYDEPVLHELLALLDALAALPGPPDVPEALRTYVGDLVERMNAHGEAYAARIVAPDPDAAQRRAVRLHALLVEAGLHPWLLDLSGAAGPAGIEVERM